MAWLIDWHMSRFYIDVLNCPINPWKRMSWTAVCGNVNRRVETQARMNHYSLVLEHIFNSNLLPWECQLKSWQAVWKLEKSSVHSSLLNNQEDNLLLAEIANFDSDVPMMYWPDVDQSTIVLTLSSCSAHGRSSLCNETERYLCWISISYEERFGEEGHPVKIEVSGIKRATTLCDTRICPNKRVRLFAWRTWFHKDLHTSNSTGQWHNILWFHSTPTYWHSPRFLDMQQGWKQWAMLDSEYAVHVSETTEEKMLVLFCCLQWSHIIVKAHWQSDKLPGCDQYVHSNCHLHHVRHSTLQLKATHPSFYSYHQLCQQILIHLLWCCEVVEQMSNCFNIMEGIVTTCILLSWRTLPSAFVCGHTGDAAPYWNVVPVTI